MDVRNRQHFVWCCGRKYLSSFERFQAIDSTLLVVVLAKFDVRPKSYK
jgi:hypothetical protein